MEDLMKKLVLFALLLPLFARAQAPETSEDIYQNPTEQQSTFEESETTDTTNVDTLRRRWRSVRCGPHSDHKCAGLRVNETCDRDNSHGIYGKCYNYGQRSPHVVCGCR